jgi:hypothetical protein
VSSCIDLGPYSRARSAANIVTAYVSLGTVSKVLEYAREIDDQVEHSDSRWSRALVRLDVATVLLHGNSRDVEQAMALGCEALDMTTMAPIRSVWQRAHELEAKAGSWARLGETAEYSGRLREWAQAPLVQTVAASEGPGGR